MDSNNYKKTIQKTLKSRDELSTKNNTNKSKKMMEN